MFTGIIEATGRVKYFEKGGASGRIVIETPLELSDANVGDSISVDGVCLTVTDFSGGGFTADVSSETLEVTTLGELKEGSRVNLEKSLTLSKPLGGHLVTGHIDGVGKITAKRPSGPGVDLEIEVGRELAGQLVKKGSVAVDGISLTVAGLTGSSFRCAIIPQTLKATTLPDKAVGARVNIETDIIGKYVQKFLKKAKGQEGVTEDFLSEHGFFSKD